MKHMKNIKKILVRVELNQYKNNSEQINESKDCREDLINSNNIEDYSHKEGKSKIKSKKLTRK